MEVDGTTYSGKVVCVWLYVATESAGSAGDTGIYSDVIVSVGSLRDYVPYQTPQTVTFPLSEGQYMAEGDYLADDGIHHVKREEIVSLANELLTLDNGNKASYTVNLFNKIDKTNNYGRCEKAIFTKVRTFEEGTFYENPANFVFVGSSEDTIETLKAKYDDAILQYELATETIEPYTQSQQESWNLIQKLMSYKGVTLISQENDNLPFNLKVVYRKDLEMILTSLDNRIKELENEGE